MDLILNYVQAGLVLAVVFIIEIIKTTIEKNRLRKKLKSIQNDVWALVVLLCGIPMTLIVHGSEKFINTNVFSFVRDIFLYAAAASFIYKSYSITKKRLSKKDGENGITD